MSLKDKLKEYRFKENLTQHELSKKIDFTRGYVSDIERGKTNGSVKFINKLSKISGLPPSYWMDSSDIETNYKPYESLDIYIENLIDKNLVDKSTGKINSEYHDSVIKILEAEILFKLKRED